MKAKALALSMSMSLSLSVLALGCGGAGGTTGGTGGVTVPPGQACGVTVVGDAASGVGRVTFDSGLTSCGSLFGTSAVMTEATSSIGSNVGFLAVTFSGSGTTGYGAGAQLTYADFTAPSLTIPLATDITPSTPNAILAASFDQATSAGSVTGLWSSKGGSVTLRLSSATPVSCGSSGFTSCLAVHGTIHAVMTGDAGVAGSPAGNGTVIMDVVF